MGKGLAQALIISAAEVFKGATPGEKITPLGYMQYLLGNASPNVISKGIDDGSGYIRGVQVRYMQRAPAGKSVTVDDCSIQTKAAYLNKTIPATHFRALGITFEDDLIATYERDALAVKNVGTPATGIMNEVWDAIIANANGLFTDINNDLLTDQAANFGSNIVTGNNTAKTINFALNGTNNPLAAGMTDIMADAMANEMKLAGSSIVGSGLILNYSLQQPAKSANQSGLNTALQQIPDFKYDPYAQTKWGANYFGLFEKDAVGFINIARFRGAKAGLRGADYFFTLKLPIYDSVGQGNYIGFEFDVQLTYRTCPDTVQIGTYDADDNPPVAVGRGWNIILMSSYSQFNVPIDAYDADDRLFGNNGTYLFTATNV